MCQLAEAGSLACGPLEHKLRLSRLLDIVLTSLASWGWVLCLAHAPPSCSMRMFHPRCGKLWIQVFGFETVFLSWRILALRDSKQACWWVQMEYEPHSVQLCQSASWGCACWRLLLWTIVWTDLWWQSLLTEIPSLTVFLFFWIRANAEFLRRREEKKTP